MCTCDFERPGGADRWALRTCIPHGTCCDRRLAGRPKLQRARALRVHGDAKASLVAESCELALHPKVFVIGPMQHVDGNP